MTKYSIKIGELFGSAFYDYNLYTSSYNVALDTTITIYCDVKNIFGNPVSNKELTLYYKGNIVATKTTNANGRAEWQLNTGNDGGTFKLAINNRWLLINVQGWKEVKSYSSGFYTLSINEFTRTARLSLKTNGNTTFHSGENYKQDNWIPSSYMPKTQMFTPVPRTARLTFYCLTNGEVGVYNTSTNDVSTNSSASIYYNY